MKTNLNIPKKVKRLIIVGFALKLVITLAIFLGLGIMNGNANNDCDKKTKKPKDVVTVSYSSWYGDHLPGFPGGEAMLVQYVSENLTYPIRPKEIGVSGTVYIGFTVNEDGTLSDIEVKKGVFSDLDEKALRVMKEMPKWEAGVRADNPVAMNVVLPIKFMLE